MGKESLVLIPDIFFCTKGSSFTGTLLVSISTSTILCLNPGDRDELDYLAWGEEISVLFQLPLLASYSQERTTSEGNMFHTL